MPDVETSVVRVRLIYEKRGSACFVPHVALGPLFARAAKRARLELSRTEGFSPHARISFGPELPASVVALGEPVDLWLSAREETTEEGRRGFLEYVNEAFNAQLPEGFLVTKCFLPAAGAPTPAKEYKAAHYLVWSGSACAAELLSHMERHYGQAFLNGFVDQDLRVSAVLSNPAQNGIGGLVKSLIANCVVAGWHDMRIVRAGLGRWNGKQMEPMEEAAARFMA